MAGAEALVTVRSTSQRLGVDLAVARPVRSSAMQRLGAAQRARQLDAHHDLAWAARRLHVQHRVEARQLVGRGVRDADQIGHLADGLGRQLADLGLRELQRRQQRRAPLRGTVSTSLRIARLRSASDSISDRPRP